jgi:hypothetical protein
VKRRLKRVGFCAGTLVLLFILFVAIEHGRGSWALNHRLEGLKAKGEELSVAALEPKRADADQNAFLALVQLSDRLSVVFTNLEDSPPSLRFVAPGRVIVAWRLKEWKSDRKTTNDWKRIGLKLQEARELQRLIRLAAQKPEYDSGFDYGKGFLDFHLGLIGKVRLAVRILSTAAGYELSEGRLDAAHQDLCALAKLTADQKPEPLVICQLVRQTCAAMAFNATWQALQAPGWDDAQLASLQTAWDGCDFVRDMAYAFEMERALDLDFYEQVKRSKESLAFAIGQRDKASEMMEGLYEPFVPPGFVRDWVYLPLWRIAWAEQDELRAFNHWQAIIERERIARTNSWAVLGERFGKGQVSEELRWYDRLRFLFSKEPFGIMESAIRRTLFMQVQQQMAISGIAVCRYRLRFGQPPSDLNALVPDLLQAPPRDSMDGKTLRYRALPDGGFVLYSVGEDGKDDGGNPAPSVDRKDYRQIWDGRDAVWPAAATDEEASAAMKSGKD